MTQGTVNGGDRGNVEDRRRRREWLVETYRADTDLADLAKHPGMTYANGEPWQVSKGHGLPACRCYRCGRLLTIDTVSPDRIIPGCKGGTYRRNNIRPACLRCQSITGNEIKRSVRGVR